MIMISFNPRKRTVEEDIDAGNVVDDIDSELDKLNTSQVDDIDIRQKIDEKTDTKTDASKQSEKTVKEKTEQKTKLPEISKETKPVKVLEAKERFNWTRGGLYLTALAIIGIVFFSQMAQEINPVFVLLIWLFGMMCFLPLGFIGGWLLLDPYMRCKIMRRFRGRNYGIVNFLHKGGQRIITRIKNFDDDVIVSEGRLWLIDKEGIHYLDKEGNKILHKVIEPESIKTLPANVPCLFLDPESMIPIKFIDTPTKTNPQQAGAICLGYINNQIRKNAMFKKSNTIVYIIIMILAGITMVISFQLYQWMEELHNTIPSLKAQISKLSELLSELTPVESIISGFLGWL